MRQRLRQLMTQEGLPYRDADRIHNTRLAQELAAWAQAEHKIDLHPALFRAHFADGLDISSPKVLGDLARAATLPDARTHEVLTSGVFAATVDQDWDRSRDLGITGVPAFVVGQHGVVGAQPYPVLAKLVHQAGALRRD